MGQVRWEVDKRPALSAPTQAKKKCVIETVNELTTETFSAPNNGVSVANSLWLLTKFQLNTCITHIRNASVRTFMSSASRLGDPLEPKLEQCFSVHAHNFCS